MAATTGGVQAPAPAPGPAPAVERLRQTSLAQRLLARPAAGALVIVVALVAPRYSLIAMIAVLLISLMVARFLSRQALGRRHNSAS